MPKRVGEEDIQRMVPEDLDTQRKWAGQILDRPLQEAPLKRQVDARTKANSKIDLQWFHAHDLAQIRSSCLIPPCLSIEGEAIEPQRRLLRRSANNFNQKLGGLLAPPGFREEWSVTGDHQSLEAAVLDRDTGRGDQWVSARDLEQLSWCLQVG